MGGVGQLTVYDADGRRKYLNKTESRRFLKAVENLPAIDAAFCLTLYYSGCRISEALNLTSQAIDWETHVIRFGTLKKRGRKETRRVPIPEPLTKQLRAVAAAQCSGKKLWNFSRSTGWRLIKAVMREAKIEGIHATAKGLRHGFGVRGAMQQIPVSVLQVWMGHAYASNTAIYLDVRDTEQRDLIKRTWKV